MLGYLNARNAKAVQKQLKALVEWMEHPSEMPYFSDFSIGSRTLSVYNIFSDSKTGSAATPRDAHPQEYAILKALSEAPLSDDPYRAVTFAYCDYSFDSLTTKYDRTCIGFAVDDETRALIETWIGEKSSDYDVISSFYDL